jgi:hypothetical protein
VIGHLPVRTEIGSPSLTAKTTTLLDVISIQENEEYKDRVTEQILGNTEETGR